MSHWAIADGSCIYIFTPRSAQTRNAEYPLYRARAQWSWRKLSVLIQIFSLCDICHPKLDVQSVGILEILDGHGLNLLSKKALWIVLQSASNTTRKNLLSISRIGAHRRMRPSFCTISFTGALTTRSIHSSRMIARSGRLRMNSKYLVYFTLLSLSYRPGNLLRASLLKTPTVYLPPTSDRFRERRFPLPDRRHSL